MVSGWIDISRPVAPGMLVYPGDPPVQLWHVAEIAAGTPYRLSELAGSVHLATHIDAPAHFVADGETIDLVAPDRFFGRARVIEPRADAIGPGDLPEAGELRGANLLFRTRHSREPWGERFDPSHAHLTLEAARMLAGAGANLVGIDYLDIEAPGGAGYPVHRALQEAGILILEGLDLATIGPGEYEWAAFPLRLTGAEAAPCRALVRNATGCRKLIDQNLTVPADT